MKQSAAEHFVLLNHKQRPNALDYIGNIFEDFIELSGDILYGDDSSVIQAELLLLTELR